MPILTLSLERAVEIALGPEGNADVQVRRELIRQAKARSAQSRSDLLPHVESSVEQVKAAEEGFSLAEAEFAQARRRYQSGIANSLEVTDAQTRLERARENRISALFNYDVARIDLGMATGTIRQMIQ